MPENKGISWDVFFRVGENGLGEHIQITEESAEALLKSRDSLMVGVTALGAIPLVRDTDYARSRPQPMPELKSSEGAATGYSTEIVPKNPNRLPNSPVSPTCPTCGSMMRLVTPRSGQTWPAFWSCMNYKTTGCQGKRQA